MDLPYEPDAYEEWTETVRVTGLGAALDAVGVGSYKTYHIFVSPGAEISEVTFTFDNT